MAIESPAVLPKPACLPLSKTGSVSGEAGRYSRYSVSLVIRKAITPGLSAGLREVVPWRAFTIKSGAKRRQKGLLMPETSYGTKKTPKIQIEAENGGFYEGAKRRLWRA